MKPGIEPHVLMDAGRICFPPRHDGNSRGLSLFSKSTYPIREGVPGDVGSQQECWSQMLLLSSQFRPISLPSLHHRDLPKVSNLIFFPGIPYNLFVTHWNIALLKPCKGFLSPLGKNSNCPLCLKCPSRSSCHGAAETNPTRNHEVAGLIPGLAQWVKHLVLL